jgi:hypothetical protein
MKAVTSEISYFVVTGGGEGTKLKKVILKNTRQITHPLLHAITVCENLRLFSYNSACGPLAVQ